MGTVYLRTTTAPDGTYQNLGTTLTQSQLDNNMTLFLRNDVSDTMTGNLFINNSSPTIHLQDTDHRSGVIHQNSNLMYFLRGDAINGTSWTQYDSYWPLILNMENNTASFGGKIEKRGINVPALHIQDTAPTPYNDGDMWWESDTGKLKIRYNDGTSAQWVDAVPIPDLTTYYSKAGGAISGAVTINSSLTTTGRIFADNGITISQGGTLASGLVITNSDIRSNATSAWTGDPTTQGKIQYHSNRWYIVADSSSDRIVQFRRSGTDVSYIDNSGNYVGNVTANVSGSSGSCPGNAATATSATSATSATNATNANTLRVVDGGTAQSPAVTYTARGGMSNPNQYAQGLFWEFKNAGQVGGLGNYAGLLTFAPWVGTTGSTGDPNYQFAIYPAGVNSTSPPTMRIRSGIDTTWGNWSVIATNARAFGQNLILG